MVFKVELLAAAVSLARDPPTIRNDGALDPPPPTPALFRLRAAPRARPPFALSPRRCRHRSTSKVCHLSIFNACSPALFSSRSSSSFLPKQKKQLEGKPERPRLAVFRSNNHIYAQVIDDTAGSTLAAASTLTPEIREKLGGSAGGNKDAAELVGAKIAELCKAANIEAVAFDRGGNVYHGRVKALAEAARAGGLNF
jgi:large subunit ribosomal protein L18